MHIHVAGVTADPKWSRDALLPLLLANGITGIRDMGGDLAALTQWRREIEAGKLVGPRIIAAGPFLADAKPGTEDTLPVANPGEGRRAVQKVKKQHGDFVKILTKLSRESYLAIADEAKIQEIDFVGHVPDSITATEASEAGQKCIEHIFYSNFAFDCSAQETELRQQRAAARSRRKTAPPMAKSAPPPRPASIRKKPTRSGRLSSATNLGLPHARRHSTPSRVNTNSPPEPSDPLLAYVPPAVRAQWFADAKED